ncbi:MAG: RidA family protein, partial [Pseudomonadota bacterium]
FNQAEVLTGMTRHVICSGQTAVDGDGQPQHAGDMQAQIGLALDNLEQVLQQADMGLVDLVHVKIYTTDMDACLEHFDVVGKRFGAAGVAAPMSLLGVTRLAMPPAMVEIEATAAQ